MLFLIKLDVIDTHSEQTIVLLLIEPNWRPHLLEYSSVLVHLYRNYSSLEISILEDSFESERASIDQSPRIVHEQVKYSMSKEDSFDQWVYVLSQYDVIVYPTK